MAVGDLPTIWVHAKREEETMKKSEEQPLLIVVLAPWRGSVGAINGWLMKSF
jgi:hypothetical protein